MQKLVILALFIAVACARLDLHNHISLPRFRPLPTFKHFNDNKTNPLTLYLEGFNSQLHIANPADLEKCVNVPLIKHINKTLVDLNKTKPDYIELVADVLALYADFQTIKHSCPQVYSVYHAYFHNFTVAFEEHPVKTFEHVLLNVGSDATNFSKHVNAAQNDIEKEQFFDAGKETAVCTAIALKGYIAV